jgi:hypothetical protein
MGACSLSPDGLQSQLGRWRRLGRGIASVERGPRRLAIVFDSGLDRALLEETVAVERDCCPFFRFEVDERTLTISVAEPTEEPALDALAHALGAAA